MDEGYGIYSVAMFQKEKHRFAVLLFLASGGFETSSGV